MATIYKICTATLWDAAKEAGVFRGAPIDFEDGYIHFSAVDQIADTAARYYVGVDNIVLLAVDTAKLGGSLRYEPASDGRRFPHLYGELNLDAVLWAKPLPLGSDGRHVFPPLAS